MDLTILSDQNSRYHKHPVLTSVLLLLIYVISVGIPALTLATSESNFLVYALTVFLVSLVVWLIIVPHTMKLPEETGSFREFLHTIGITRYRSKSQVLLFGVLGVTIILFTFLVSAIAYGDWVPNLSRMIPPIAWSPIFAINGGIWEEVAFRGVLLTFLLKKYDQSRAILLDSLIFSFAHGFNIIMGTSVIVVLLQMAFTFTAGLMFAYLFIKTESLIPSILIHYATDASAEFFFYQMFLPSADPITTALFIYPTFGVASLLIILLVFVISKYTKKNTRISEPL